MFQHKININLIYFNKQNTCKFEYHVYKLDLRNNK